MIDTIIVGVIHSYFFCQISNLPLEKPQELRSNILSCNCTSTYGLYYIFAEKRGNGPKPCYDLSKIFLLSKNEIRMVEKTFSMLAKNFLNICFCLHCKIWTYKIINHWFTLELEFLFFSQW